MKRASLAVFAIAAVAALAFGTYAIAGGGKKHVKADKMNGYDEVPAVSSEATGKFDAEINNDGTAITFTETYSGLEADATQSHIHFGQRAVSGGVSIFLCTNLGNGPAGTQPCPLRAGTVTGTIHAGDVIGPAAQGISAGELNEIIAAIRAGKAYANVHSTKFPAGEIRGQINDKGKHGH